MKSKSEELQATISALKEGRPSAEKEAQREAEEAAQAKPQKAEEAAQAQTPKEAIQALQEARKKMDIIYPVWHESTSG